MLFDHLEPARSNALSRLYQQPAHLKPTCRGVDRTPALRAMYKAAPETPRSHLRSCVHPLPRYKEQSHPERFLPSRDRRPLPLLRLCPLPVRGRPGPTHRSLRQRRRRFRRVFPVHLRRRHLRRRHLRRRHLRRRHLRPRQPLRPRNPRRRCRPRPRAPPEKACERTEPKETV
jgi:hypothetical protein